MHHEDSELIKQREIRFCPVHPAPNQAEDAALALKDAVGIEKLSISSANGLSITYDLRFISLQAIEEALIQLGFHLDNSLFYKLRRALVHYMEDTQRANMGDDHEIKSTRDVFINRYGKLPHGCRDKRPPHWREYL